MLPRGLQRRQPSRARGWDFTPLPRSRNALGPASYSPTPGRGATAAPRPAPRRRRRRAGVLGAPRARRHPGQNPRPSSVRRVVPAVVRRPGRSAASRATVLTAAVPSASSRRPSCARDTSSRPDRGPAGRRARASSGGSLQRTPFFVEETPHRQTPGRGGALPGPGPSRQTRRRRRSTGSLGHVRRAASGFAPAADRDAPLVRLRVEFPRPGRQRRSGALVARALGHGEPGRARLVTPRLAVLRPVLAGAGGRPAPERRVQRAPCRRVPRGRERKPATGFSQPRLRRPASARPGRASRRPADPAVEDPRGRSRGGSGDIHRPAPLGAHGNAPAPRRPTQTRPARASAPARPEHAARRVACGTARAHRRFRRVSFATRPSRPARTHQARDPIRIDATRDSNAIAPNAVAPVARSATAVSYSPGAALRLPLMPRGRASARGDGVRGCARP